ncbi:MAG: thiolase family protein [Marinosulfonomonas sp.]|nr:thiolase family protein [Marinosulfonomonas sp.]
MSKTLSRSRGRFAIIGVGNTSGGVMPLTSTGDAMFAEAAIMAIKEAGIDKAEINGLVTHGTEDTRVHQQRIGAMLGIQADFATSVDNGGASQVCSIITACMAIDAGLADVVLCGYSADYRAKIHRAGKKQAVQLVPESMLAEQFRFEFGYFGEMASYAFGATRHMHLYGTTKEDFARVAVTQRDYASRNPDAQYRKPITVDEHLNARRIVDPFGLLDCCPVSDGAGVVIVARADRAANIKKNTAYILGYGTGNNIGGLFAGENMSQTAGLVSSKTAYEMAGITPKDVDTAQFYDTTTAQTIIQLEDYGFCKKGEGGAFVQSGATGPDGVIPTNTAGGLLSEGHVAGMWHILEGVRQVRQSHPAERQVSGAEIAVISGNGGNSVCHGSLVLSRNPS